MTIKSDLQAARALIDTPDKWCQGHDREGKDGVFVKFCGNGALAHVTNFMTSASHDYEHAYDHLANVAGTIVSSFNDTHTHAEVLELFDRAIAAAGDE